MVAGQGPTRKHPPGTVAVICDRLARYTDFYECLTATTAGKRGMPEGSAVFWSQGVNVPENHARAVDNMHGEWLWILGDDHQWDPSALMSLLDAEVDVIVPIVMRRTHPFLPVLYQRQDEEGGFPYLDLNDEEPDSRGLIEVGAAGSAGMLIRKHVLDALPRPAFPQDETVTPTEENPERIRRSTDLLFCERVREAGFRIFAHTGVLMGHMNPATVWPHQRAKDGRWGVVFDFNGDVRFFMPYELPKGDA